jgi:hypothetical protein
MLNTVGVVIDDNAVPEESKSAYERIQSAGYNVSLEKTDAFNTDTGAINVDTAFI